MCIAPRSTSPLEFTILQQGSLRVLLGLGYGASGILALANNL